MLAPLYRAAAPRSSIPFLSTLSLQRLSSAYAYSSNASSSRPSPAQLKIMSAKSLVEDSVSNTPVVIFSKSYCPYCKRAKSLFAANYPDVETKIYELDEMDEGAAIQDYLLTKTGQRTVPNIFVNQTHVGGSSDVAEKQNSGELAKLINV